MKLLSYNWRNLRKIITNKLNKNENNNNRITT